MQGSCFLLVLLLLITAPTVLCSSSCSSGAPSSSAECTSSKRTFWEPALHGFLSASVFSPEAPYLRLPAPFEPFYLSLELPLLHAGNNSVSHAHCDALQAFIRGITTAQAAEELLPSLSPEELEEANLVVAMANHRYLHCQLAKKEQRVVPASVARLHVELSSLLGRRPSLSYVHLVLNNCWRRAAHAPHDVFVQAPDFELRYLITGLKGERGFYLSHCEVEAISIPVVRAGMAISSQVCQEPQLAAGEGEEQPTMIDVPALVENLNTMADSIRLMVVSLKRMFRYVTPKEFLQQVRPFFEFDEMKSPKGVTFEGVFAEPQFFPGPTGAMTSTLPFIDAVLSLKLHDPTLNNLMSEFRSFWPKPHLALISNLEACPFGLKRLLTEERFSSALLPGKEEWDLLSSAYDDVLTAMGELRAAHVLHTETFILSQLPPHVQKNIIGTGGTPFTRYLCTHTLDTISARIRKDSPSVAVPHSCFQGISLSQVMAAAQRREFDP